MEDKLLNDILNELDITYEDEATKKKVTDIMKRGMGYLDNLYGSNADYVNDMDARELLFSYSRYGRSNAINEFEQDFKGRLIMFSLKGAMLDE